jgi:hypothetical protein
VALHKDDGTPDTEAMDALEQQRGCRPNIVGEAEDQASSSTRQ